MYHEAEQCTWRKTNHVNLYWALWINNHLLRAYCHIYQLVCKLSRPTVQNVVVTVSMTEGGATRSVITRPFYTTRSTRPLLVSRCCAVGTMLTGQMILAVVRLQIARWWHALFPSSLVVCRRRATSCVKKLLYLIIKI